MLQPLWLPIKALLLNLLSLAAAFGVVTFIWQDGHGTHALFSTPATFARKDLPAPLDSPPSYAHDHFDARCPGCGFLDTP
jgi:uncharacterized membrane protein YdfJ with MMPL/SSD domain